MSKDRIVKRQKALKAIVEDDTGKWIPVEIIGIHKSGSFIALELTDRFYKGMFLLRNTPEFQ